MIIGKQIKGPTRYLPKAFFWGGCLFINFWRRSLMIPLNDHVQNFLESIGVNIVGD